MNKTKVYYLLLAIVAVLMSGCKSSAEDLITDELREYVRNNFDDPKSFKEVVSIEPIDTVNNEKYIKLLVSCLISADNADSLNQKILDTVTKDNVLSAKCRNGRDGAHEYEISKLITSFQSAMNFITEWQPAHDLCKKDITAFVADTASLAKTDMIVYLIKYRSIEGSELVLKEMWAIVDRAKEENNISIRIAPMTKNELPEPLLDILEKMEAYLSITQKKVIIYKGMADSYNKLKILL